MSNNEFDNAQSPGKSMNAPVAASAKQMPDKQASHSSSGSQTRASTGPKILVVEDNELNLKLFCDLLEAHDFTPLKTKDGEEAVAIARAQQPALILMDIQLPQVSGLDITRRIKSDPLTSKIPIVAITAFAMRGDEEKVKQAGCEGYISKPVSVQLFIDTVRTFLRRD